MAATDSGQEKTEDATPKKLREARKKGQVPKSRDVNTIMVLLSMFAVLCFGIGWMGLQLKDLMVATFQQAGTQGTLEGSVLYSAGKASFMTWFKIMAPLCLVGVAIAALSGFLQVGPVFSMEPLKPQLKKLNAIEGLKNMFKTQTFIELLKNIAKIGIVFYLAYSTINGDLYTILQTASGPVDNYADKMISISNAASLTGDIVFRFVIKVLIAFLVISLVDFMVQRKQFMKQMKMTKDEVKREYKQDEGDPHIKSHRRQLHREFAFGDVRQQVKQSDVVVTNPVHVAVALRYDKKEMVAPEIAIKGQCAFAEMIVEVAKENGIPIMRNIPLAWSLFELEEGTEVPEELFTAVAELLAYVYRMKQLKEQGVSEDKIQYI